MKKHNWRDKIESFISFRALVGGLALTLSFGLYTLTACAPSNSECPSGFSHSQTENYKGAWQMDHNDDGWICTKPATGLRYSIVDNWYVVPTWTPPSDIKCPSDFYPTHVIFSAVEYNAAKEMDGNDDGWICEKPTTEDRYSISDNQIVVPTLAKLLDKGLFIQGTILGADTGRGIPGAAYIVLNPGITVDSWDGSDDQGYTWAQADANGYFELPRPLERNQRYSIIIWAEGYLPAGGDDILVSDEPSPLEVEITLQRE